MNSLRTMPKERLLSLISTPDEINAATHEEFMNVKRALRTVRIIVDPATPLKWCRTDVHDVVTWQTKNFDRSKDATQKETLRLASRAADTVSTIRSAIPQNVNKVSRFRGHLVPALLRTDSAAGVGAALARRIYPVRRLAEATTTATALAAPRSAPMAARSVTPAIRRTTPDVAAPLAPGNVVASPAESLRIAKPFAGAGVVGGAGQSAFVMSSTPLLTSSMISQTAKPKKHDQLDDQLVWEDLNALDLDFIS